MSILTAAAHEAPHMSSHNFDTLAYAKKMKAVGFTEAQAEAQAEGLAEVIDEKLATKQDLKDLENSSKQEFKELRTEMQQMEKRLTYELTIRLGSMLITGITVLAILIKIF